MSGIDWWLQPLPWTSTRSTYSESFSSLLQVSPSLPTLSESTTASQESLKPLCCFSYTTLELGSHRTVLSPLSLLHSQGQLNEHHRVSWGCSGKQAKFPHCFRFLLNYLQRFLDLRRPYLILPSLSWNGAVCRGALPRHFPIHFPTHFPIQTTPPWKNIGPICLSIHGLCDLEKCLISSFHIFKIGIITAISQGHCED